MSVAVLCNLSDGVIIGVDSALSVFSTTGVSKVFEDGDKLFQIAKRIGVATYGLAGMEGRSGNFVRQFERENEGTADRPLSETVERLRLFFLGVYVRYVESVYSVPFDQVTADLTPLGLVVTGYSPGEFFAEAWEVQIPANRLPHSARKVYGPGEFGLAWFAASEPIDHYLNGVPSSAAFAFLLWAEKTLGRPLAQAEIDGALAIRDESRYTVITDSMPLQTGIEYVKFLVNLVIGHHRFSAGHPIVGGRVKVGVISYEQESFAIQG